MYKRTILFAALILFATAGFAAEKNIEVLQAKLDVAHSKLKDLEEENRDLKKRLASRENEASGYKLALANIEEKIAVLKGGVR
jgi:predicted  nucleic acid-binding Zn-ribbon protein